MLLVSDAGVVAAGHAHRAAARLEAAGLTVVLFSDVHENPTTQDVAAGVAAARGERIDMIVGLGGGSAMDCAKGVNLILTNGGKIADYRGENKTSRPLLPFIAVPTTAGTGSEAQSFALISDAATHEKIACGDRRPPEAGGMRPRWAILDPELTRTVPLRVAATAGIDAVAHAVETSAAVNRNAQSLELSGHAWQLLKGAFLRSLHAPDDTARADMLLGAHLAGAAIERAMLGAAHACANPLTARFGIVHGQAVGLLLPHVVRFNTECQAPPGSGGVDHPYAPLAESAEELASELERLLDGAGLARTLRDLGVEPQTLPDLARQAASQHTARFNPRPVGTEELLEIYQRAW